LITILYSSDGVTSGVNLIAGVDGDLSTYRVPVDAPAVEMIVEVVLNNGKRRVARRLVAVAEGIE
jgi:hypothetical protein